MAGQNVIVKFKKSSSADERHKILKDIEAKGGKIENDEFVGSSVFPHATVNVSPDQFSSLQSSFDGHDVVEHLEQDSEVHTQ